MDIFKLFESTIPNVQPGHPSTKELRRDQLLDNYDEAIKSLQTLAKSKENEIAYRRDLVDMLEKSKSKFDKKLSRAKQAYQIAKKHAPQSLDFRSPAKRPALTSPSSSSSHGAGMYLTSTSPPLPSTTTMPPMSIQTPGAPLSGMSQRGSDSLDIPLPLDGYNEPDRTSLDRRLSEFLKTFPNLTQAGLTQPTANEVKPMPGYYTPQPPIAAQHQTMQPIPGQQAAMPPMMAMMRYPPPAMMPPQTTNMPHNTSPYHNRRRR